MGWLTLPSRVLARGMVRWTLEVVLPRPRAVIAACVAVVLLCAAGVHRLELATRTDQLWVPQDTAVMSNRERVRALFGSEPEWHSVIVSPAEGSASDALAAAVVDAVFALEAKIEALPGWQEACLRLRDDQPCVRNSVTALWCDYDAFAAEVLAAGDASAQKEAILFKINGPSRDSCSFGPLERLRVLGAPAYDDGGTFETASRDSEIVTAKSVYGAYLLDVDKGEAKARAAAEAFEALMTAERLRLGASAGTTNTKSVTLTSESSVTTDDTVTVVNVTTHAPPLTVDFAYSLAFDTEISRSVTGDIPLVAASFAAISVATSLGQLFRKKRSDVSFATAANWGVLSVALGVATGYGVVIWCGVKFTSLAQIGPFIFLGVGVDDVVVLLEAFRSARETIRDGGSVRERFEFVAERAGVSIAITSITNFLAFALGSLTVIPAVSWFCLYASVTILCDFAIVASFFLAVLVLLETADQNAGRPKRAFDAAAAETRPLPPSRTEAQRARRRDVERRLAETTTTKTTSENASNASSGVFDRVVRGYAEFLMRTSTRVAVLLVFAGYGAAGLANVGSVKEGLPRTALAPDDSFLQGYFSKFDASFESQTGIALEHHFQGFRHETPQAQARVFAAWGVFLGSPYVEAVATYASEDGASPASNWLVAAVAAANAANASAPCASLGVAAEVCALAAVPFGGLEVTGAGGPNLIPEPFFMDALNAAVAARPEIAAVLRRPPDASSPSGLGAPVASAVITRAQPVADDYPMQLRIYEDMIRCDEEIRWMFEAESNGGVEAVAARTDVVVGTRVDDSVDDSVGATTVPIVASVAFDRPRAFTFSENLVYWQQDAVLWNELVVNLSLAGTGVFIVCVLALAHPAALVAVAGVGVVDVFLFTTLVIGDIRFNVISVINFVMAVGLAVDYTLHFCHAFLAAPGICEIERVQYTMRTMGSSILKGGGTTLVGTLPMAFSRSVIFRTFFALLFSTIVYGLAVGLILIPVVLSIVPLPAATHLHVEGIVPDVDEALDRFEALAEAREGGKKKSIA